MKPNGMKEKIARGEAALGLSLMFPSPQIVEMAAHAGFDWVLLDCEHGSLSLPDVEVMAMAADATGITPIARPRSNAPADIQAVMDRGVMGVQVPHVTSGEEARRAVASVKLGPGSLRSLAAGTRPDRWGLGARMPDFVAAANARSLVCLQIEDEAAVRNIDAILAVEGIDVFFIGPSDLSQSMGHPGNPRAAPVLKAISETLARIRAAGRVPGMPATDETLAEVLGQGCRYIYTHLPKILGAGAKGFLGAARKPA